MMAEDRTVVFGGIFLSQEDGIHTVLREGEEEQNRENVRQQYNKGG